MKKKAFNRVIVPVFEFDENNLIKPNPLFHRPWDHLHSRCIEYPYCASKLGQEDYRILDIGTAKADRAWIAWLEQLPMKVHGLDYDVPEEEFDQVLFVRSDARTTPYPDDYFDVVIAVSVIEHIGLTDPQIKKSQKPSAEKHGDLEAVKEIARILRPGGRLLMTVPFGKRAGPLLNEQARSYDRRTIQKFDAVLQRHELEIFEYGFVGLPSRGSRQRMMAFLTAAILFLFRSILGINLSRTGLVTWSKIGPEACKARNRWHVDAVACGVWEKR